MGISKKLAAIVEEEGLSDLRDAHLTYLRREDSWHEATDVLRQTPPGHPLYREATRQYWDSREDFANAATVLKLEEIKAQRAWLARQEA